MLSSQPIFSRCREAKRSHPFTEEASKHTGASSKSSPEGKTSRWPHCDFRKSVLWVLPAFQKSMNQKRSIWKIIIGCQKENSRVHCLPQDAKSLSKSQASGNRFQSLPKEDEDVKNLLSPVVKHIPNLVTRIEENLKKHFGNFGLTNFLVNTATWCIFARDYIPK